MKEHENEFSVEKIKVLGISRSGYYDFLKAEKSTRAKENERLKAKIKDIHEMSRGA